MLIIYFIVFFYLNVQWCYSLGFSLYALFGFKNYTCFIMENLSKKNHNLIERDYSFPFVFFTQFLAMTNIEKLQAMHI